MLCFIAEQIGVSDRDFEDYATRLQTRRAHLSELQAYLGVRPFRREDYRAVAKAALGEATGTDRGDAIVAVMIDHLRKRSILLPSIAANVSEAAHILDGLLHHECSLEIREHYTDTAGAFDHVFGLCHLLGFRFAPRIRDLADRRLYVADGRAVYTALKPMIGGTSIFVASVKTGMRRCAARRRSKREPSRRQR
jgi:TnpA family transposase